jgi:hypothetical protein
MTEYLVSVYKLAFLSVIPAYPESFSGFHRRIPDPESFREE